MNLPAAPGSDMACDMEAPETVRGLACALGPGAGAGEGDGGGGLPATTACLPAIAWRAGQARPGEEVVAEEVPVALVYNGISHAVMLATPADLEDFALGFSLSEGLLDSPADLLDCEWRSHVLDGAAAGPAGEAMAACAGVTVELRITQRCFMRLKEKRRNLTGRTGCGLCGTENLSEAVRPVARRVQGLQPDLAVIERAMAALGEAQTLQRATGASHAAAYCSLAGDLLALREDVGRHNALDKLIGWLARSGHAPAQGFIVVTSRASYEMVHKTASAGVGLLAAISAPTALAARTAQSAGLTLLGYVRGDRATVYAGPGVAPG